MLGESEQLLYKEKVSLSRENQEWRTFSKNRVLGIWLLGKQGIGRSCP
jgi:hypothetical protein